MTNTELFHCLTLLVQWTNEELMCLYAIDQYERLGLSGTPHDLEHRAMKAKAEAASLALLRHMGRVTTQEQ